ncbi:hypothetical protein L1049_025796 [Liquidambar formosana]|uniref:Protein kinase domain-containing protein n=1 Tax=Liquidambar formosana TaxID=63359 RepID=A0AAP0NBY3_LIQFO
MINSNVQAVLAATASFFLVTIIFAAIYIICRDRTQRSESPRPRTRTRAAIPEPSSITTGESASFDPSLSRISMPELIAATGNFAASGIIGDGSFGLVYKARLANGVTVAVKKLSPDAFQGFREFRAEMETLGRLRNRNIVKMLGYCVSGSDRVLIYEFIEKGSLDQWLYDTASFNDVARSEPLSWEKRMKVVRGVANGLLYLHGLEKPIIHRDIKASNVLLDKDFEAHIADFGLARSIDASHSHVSTQVAGTMGYMPPEYREGLTLATVKADVYSFGILMVEIATGKRPNWPVKAGGKEVCLVEWARKMVAENQVMDMVDPNVAREGLREVEVEVGEYFRIACLCTSEDWRERPVMGEVVEMLNRIST